MPWVYGDNTWLCPHGSPSANRQTTQCPRYACLLVLQKILLSTWPPISYWDFTLCLSGYLPGSSLHATDYKSLGGVRHPGYFVSLNQEFRKDILMWQIFLDHWNGVSLFLPPLLLSPLPKFTFLRTRPVPLATGVSSITYGSRVNGPLSISSTLPLAYASSGKSSTQFTWPALGSPMG